MAGGDGSGVRVGVRVRELGVRVGVGVGIERAAGRQGRAMPLTAYDTGGTDV